MIIVSSEIFFFKYFDFIKDINIRVLSERGHCVVSDTILKIGRCAKIWKWRNFSLRHKAKIFGPSAKIFSNLEAGEFQVHAELASSSHEDLSISFESPDEG